MHIAETSGLSLRSRTCMVEGGKNNINTAFIYKILNIYLILFYEYVCSVCMYVGLPSAWLVPIEVRRRY